MAQCGFIHKVLFESIIPVWMDLGFRLGEVIGHEGLGEGDTRHLISQVAGGSSLSPGGDVKLLQEMKVMALLHLLRLLDLYSNVQLKYSKARQTLYSPHTNMGMLKCAQEQDCKKVAT